MGSEERSVNLGFHSSLRHLGVVYLWFYDDMCCENVMMTLTFGRRLAP
jgi:hypothetical protein